MTAFVDTILAPVFILMDRILDRWPVRSRTTFLRFMLFTGPLLLLHVLVCILILTVLSPALIWWGIWGFITGSLFKDEP